MSEMVERVARAIHKSTRNWHGLEDNWDSLVSAAKDITLDNALAAIEAMRDSTEAMKKVEGLHWLDVDGCPVCVGVAES